MVQAAKDGSIVKLLSSGEECMIGPYVCNPGPNHVNVNGTCFSSSSTVQTPSGVIAIKNLRLNDSVLTFTPGVGAQYTEVHSHSHVVSYPTPRKALSVRPYPTIFTPSNAHAHQSNM